MKTLAECDIATEVAALADGRGKGCVRAEPRGPSIPVPCYRPGP